MRRIFSTVRRPHEPAFTVESLAMMQTVRPSIVAVPVTTPSAGSSGSRLFASAASSTNDPGIDELRDALAREELPGLGVLLVVLRGAALFDARQGFFERFFGAGHAPHLVQQPLPWQLLLSNNEAQLTHVESQVDEQHVES